jgi:hypothetical protein
MALALVFITLLGFIPYLFLVWRAPEMRWARVRATLVTFAVLFRVGLLFTPPLLSNDTPRYLWDGKVQVAGLNPYRHAPDAPAVAHLRDATWEQLDHRDVPGVYPPLLLLVFRCVAFFTPHPWTFKLLFALADLFTFWFLVQILRARKQNESRALIWGLNPLVILEFAGSGHEMSLAIMFFVAGLWLQQHRLTPLAALGYAAATLSHTLALPLAVTMLAASHLKSVRIWLWYLLPIAAGYALFADAGRSVVTGLLHFAGRWRFNGSLYELFSRGLDDEVGREWAGIWFAHPRTKLVLGGMLVVVWVELLRRRVPAIRATLTMAGVLLLFAATVHPWYVTWLVALVCLEFSLGWLMFSAVVLVSYVARIAQLQTGVWADTAYTRWLEYVPLYLLLIREWWRKRFDSAAAGQ